jgi:hypothetical protein
MISDMNEGIGIINSGIEVNRKLIRRSTVARSIKIVFMNQTKAQFPRPVIGGER